MEITPQCVVALTWTLSDSLGEVLDELSSPVEFLVGGTDLLTRVEEALQGHVAGDTLRLHLEPEEAFGDYDGSLVFLEPRAHFPETLEAGMTFEGLPEGCTASAPKDRLYVVTDLLEEQVVLDANHPLAGISLEIEVTVQGVREATENELNQGTAGVGFFKVQPQAPGSDSLH